jgi:molecular chaperone GrpE
MTDDAIEQNPGGAPADAEPSPSELVELPASEGPRDEPGGIEALQLDLAACQERLLRVAAEFDNYRKRTERERRERADRTVTDLLLDIVGVVDDLELALTADADLERTAAYRDGVELIHRKILELLKRRDVRPIEAVGADFDPNLHQAVTVEDAKGRRESEVVEELRRGYMIGDRLLRPAMVKVARS